jgi:hypothetical protein
LKQSPDASVEVLIREALKLLWILWNDISSCV